MATCSSVRLDGELEARSWRWAATKLDIVNVRWAKCIELRITGIEQRKQNVHALCLRVCMCVFGLQIIWLAAGIDGHFMLPGIVRFMTSAEDTTMMISSGRGVMIADFTLGG